MKTATQKFLSKLNLCFQTNKQKNKINKTTPQRNKFHYLKTNFQMLNSCFSFFFHSNKNEKNMKKNSGILFFFMRNDLFPEMYTIFYISPENHNLERWSVGPRLFVPEQSPKHFSHIARYSSGTDCTKRSSGGRSRLRGSQSWQKRLRNGTPEICNCAFEDVMTKKVFLWLICTDSGKMMSLF